MLLNIKIIIFFLIFQPFLFTQEEEIIYPSTPEIINSIKDNENEVVMVPSYLKTVETSKFTSKFIVINEEDKDKRQIMVNSYSIIVSSYIYQLVKDYNPNFQLWKAEDLMPRIFYRYDFSFGESPQALFIDFNGDLIRDVILWGYDDKNWLILSLISKKTSDIPHDFIYEISTRAKWPSHKKEDLKEGVCISLSLIKPSDKIQGIEGKEDEEVEFKNYAFETGCEDSPVSLIHYYKDGKWHIYNRGD
ncbi:MAG: hypothetical protein GX445_02095 [Elusimicrobia bacterium]|nr:hypothetical protein [Elusimicrobiota bacterium]